MNAVEDYSRKWAKKEGVDGSALSEWVKAIRQLVKCRVFVYVILCLQDLNLCLKIRIAAKLADIHDQFVVVPADKASNNVVFVCKQILCPMFN